MSTAVSSICIAQTPDQFPIMLIRDLLLYLLSFATSVQSHAISTAVNYCNSIEVSKSTLNFSPSINALGASNLAVARRQTTTSTNPCGSSNPCPSTTSSTQCGSSNPCPTGATTETETHLATMTIQTTEMQTAYVTDHKTIPQHTLRMVTKTVKEAGTTTATSTVPGCSTVTTTTTSMSLTTTINWVSAPASSSSACGGYSCTVTTTKATDVNMPTSATGKAKISGHDVVQVISEQDLLKKVADNERQENAAVIQPSRLVARQNIETTFKTVVDVDTRSITRSLSSLK